MALMVMNCVASQGPRAVGGSKGEVWTRSSDASCPTAMDGATTASTSLMHAIILHDKNTTSERSRWGRIPKALTEERGVSTHALYSLQKDGARTA